MFEKRGVSKLTESSREDFFFLEELMIGEESKKRGREWKVLGHVQEGKCEQKMSWNREVKAKFGNLSW